MTPGARRLPPAPRTPSAGQVAALRGDLETAGYTVAGVADLLGPVATAALARDEALPARLACEASAEPASTLLSLFVLGGRPTRRAVDAALAGATVDGTERLGLLTTAGPGPDDEVLASVDLRPHAAEHQTGPADWWIASDLAETAARGPLCPDHVLGVGGASTMLAQCTVRRSAEAVLDVGTGCGVQALHAGRHAARVLGTDISPRCLAFAGFNAALNRADVELRCGDLLAPVAGEQFDLVVSNPPFVVTPRGAGVPRHVYRDGGLLGDTLVARLVAQVAGVLAPDGIAQLLGNWELRSGQQWSEPVEAWLAGTGLDGWVIQRDVSDPAFYAETWLRDGGQPPGADFDRLYRAWLADFAARGVTSVGFGLITLRRPGGGRPRSPRLRFDDHPGELAQPLGAHLGDCLAAGDWLDAHDDSALLRARLVRAGDVTEERHFVPGEPDPRVVLLRQGGGLRRSVPAATELAGFVGACDGELSAGQLVGAVGAVLGLEVADLRARLLPAVRELVACAMLRPAAEGGAEGG